MKRRSFESVAVIAVILAALPSLLAAGEPTTDSIKQADDLFRSGKEQRQLDKEYVRQWLSDQGFTGEGNPPALTEEVRKEAARRYIAAYEVITGRDLEITSEPIGQRIESELRSRGYIA